jgi:hypothetical protein
MDGDFAKLFAGQMGICAVVLNVLIDRVSSPRTSFVRASSKPRCCGRQLRRICRSRSPSRNRFLP